MKGYKVFNPDWTCRGYQYKVGETFEEDAKPSCCNRGFHFCTELKDCFNYYSFDPDNRVAEIEALGEVDAEENGVKRCTNKIKIVREITWQEVLKMVNTGKACTGLCNVGNLNTGNRNTGNCNTGDWNTGNWNTGDRNTGDRNTGNCNAGDRNSGNRNSGNRNTGDWNTGCGNTGNCNAGDRNSGNRNTGDWNTGCGNTGNCNTGNRNTGNCNTGDWNNTNFSSGCFNTEESKILMFNKPSDWTFRNWFNSEARYLLNSIQKNALEWIGSSDMTDEEKEQHPEYKTTGGYLKELDESESVQAWWDGLDEKDRDIIRDLPNFDAAIFEKCTGIKDM